jgi:hypothetical protein
MFARPAASSLRFPDIGLDFDERCREIGRASGLYEPALVWQERFRNAANLGRNNRQACGHAAQQDQRERIGSRRDGENVNRLEEFVGRHVPAPVDRTRQGEFSCQRLQAGQQFSCPGDPQS